MFDPWDSQTPPRRWTLPRISADDPRYPLLACCADLMLAVAQHADAYAILQEQSNDASAAGVPEALDRVWAVRLTCEQLHNALQKLVPATRDEKRLKGDALLTYASLAWVLELLTYPAPTPRPAPRTAQTSRAGCSRRDAETPPAPL